MTAAPARPPLHRPGARLRARLALLAVVAVTVALLPALAAPAAAEPDSATTLTLSAPASGKAGRPVPFTMVLADAGGTPVSGAEVVLERLSGDWVRAGAGTTDGTGRAVVPGTLPAGTTTWRATYAGDGTRPAAVSQTVEVTGLRHATTLVLDGPRRLVDERSARLSLTWRADDGSDVDGLVTLHRRLGTGRWQAFARLRTRDGRATLSVRPRVDSTWRATGAHGPWWRADASDYLHIDNVPPIRPVGYPAAAPRPVRTPAQARARGAGPNAVVTRVPDGVWRSMVGRSWHRGCPVGRSGLRLLRVNYWGFDGYRYRGEVVLASSVVRRAAGALGDMYRDQLPIRRMYRVDRFGWSKRLRGANDYASMRADNTSGFNCRNVVNRPGVLSPHARGRSIDINPWENPYRSATGLVPNSWWHSRSHPKIAWRSSSHPVVRIWRNHGFRWTYGTGDSHHYDGRVVMPSSPAGGFTG